MGMNIMIKGNSYYRRRKRRNRVIAFILVFLLVATVALAYGYRRIVNDPPYETLISMFDSLSTYNMAHVDVEIEFLPNEGKASFSSSMEIQPQENSRRFLVFALSDGLDITDARINGTRARVFNLWVANFMYIPSSLRNEPFEIKLEYSGKPEGFFSAFTNTYLTAEGGHLDGNSLWLPFMPGEGEPFRSNTTLVSPKDFTGVTGGRLLEAITVGDKNISFWDNSQYSAVVFHKYDHYEYNGEKAMRIFGPEDFTHRLPLVAELSDEIVKIYEELL